jgi:hypothetical protein
MYIGSGRGEASREISETGGWIVVGGGGFGAAGGGAVAQEARSAEIAAAREGRMNSLQRLHEVRLRGLPPAAPGKRRGAREDSVVTASRIWRSLSARMVSPESAKAEFVPL